MRLSKLEIYGFKSFAKRTQIVFPANITGIVGPNGCGKSNISDAVRWVLGEQSAKSLRGNAMTDVIFNGTQNRKAMNYCEVTLIFDNTDGTLGTEFSEVSVTRRVFRSGDSEYILNGNACRLKDIINLFRDTGLGREGYSIVGQTRMDEILSNKSEDRRAVVEEAAGISRYRARKEEAERRLARSDENLSRVEDILEELNGLLEPMAVQAETAKEYLALSETLRELDVSLYLIQYDRLKKRTATVEDALAALAEEIETATQQLKALTEKRQTDETRVDELQAALDAAHQALLLKKEQLHEAREKRQTVSGRIESAKEAVERLEAERQAVYSRQKMIEATANESEAGAEETERLRAEAEDALARHRQEHAETTKAADALEDELSRHKTNIIETMNRWQEHQTAHTRQATMLAQMEKRKAELTDTLAGDVGREASLREALETAQHNLDTEKSRLTERQSALSEMQTRTAALKDQAEEKQKIARETAEQARALELRIETLEELAQGYEGYQHAVKQALSYAHARGISGVHDVVAKVISVPKSYEIAFDMALGASMQHIITDTEDTAKTLIEHLRQNRLGRATFLPISAMQGRTLNGRERSVLSMKGCLGVASELCDYPETYRGVMENLLGRTVVAEDLQSGVQIMRAGGHSFRLVTLQGDVMHPGGSMTGGSVQQKAQNLLGRDRVVRELKDDLKQKTAQLEQAMQAMQQLEEEQAEMLRQADDARYQLQQQEIAVVRDTERHASATSDLRAHTERLDAVRDAIRQLDEDAAEIQEDLRRAAEETSGQAPDQDAMAEKTNQLSAQLDTARRERERTQEALTAALLALQQAENQCDRIRRDASRLVTEREACDNELLTITRKLEQAEQTIRETETQLTQADERIQQATEEASAAEEAVRQAEQSRVSAQKALKELQIETEAVRLSLEKATDRQHRQEMSMERAKAELEQLDQRLWDTYELTYAGAQAARDEYQKRDGEQEQAFDEKAAAAQAKEIRDRVKAMGHVNTGAIEEYTQLNERITGLTVQQSDLIRAKEDLQSLISSLLKEMRHVFTEQFVLMQQYFAESFKRLFNGGHAELKLTDPSDPLGCDVEIIVQPPGKKRQILSLFSNGERALTAIALLFAMLKLRPSPFCILDEAEAALDEANVGSFGDYLHEMGTDTQFITITHRKGTMERCDSLFGVAMEERGVSDLVSVNLKDYQ